MTEAAAGQQRSNKSLDLVQLRELLGELCQRKESDTLLQVVFGVLLQAEKVIEDQAVEIQQLRKQLFGRRSEKLSPDQLSLFAQMLATVTAAPSNVETPSPSGAPAAPPKKKRRKASPRPPLTPTQSHEIRVPDEERDCPHCGGPRCAMGHCSLAGGGIYPAEDRRHRVSQGEGRLPALRGRDWRCPGSCRKGR